MLWKARLAVSAGVGVTLLVAVLAALLLKARLEETQLRLEQMAVQVEVMTEASQRMARQTQALVEQLERINSDQTSRDRAIDRETDQCLDVRLPSGLLD